MLLLPEQKILYQKKEMMNEKDFFPYDGEKYFYMYFIHSLPFFLSKSKKALQKNIEKAVAHITSSAVPPLLISGTHTPTYIFFYD